MKSLKINGGNPIEGIVEPIPNKNSILPIICASVLTDKPIILHNVPKSSSVRVMLSIYRELGGKVKYLSGSSIKLDSSSIHSYVISKELAAKERASLMFLGPLLKRFGKAEIGIAGGCKLGNRPVDTLYQGLQELGAEYDKRNFCKLKTKGLKGKEDIYLLEASVTGTENLIITAVLAKGKTVIFNAACEPHVQDLCNFLNSIGAKIEGVGSNRLEIHGVSKLKGGEWTIIADHLDIGGLIVATAITGGDLTIKNAITEHMSPILNNFKKFNLEYVISGNDINVPRKQNLSCQLNIKGDIDIIRGEPWPGYPVDLIPQIAILAMKSKGSMRIMSYMYESQLFFLEALRPMRARYIISDPHRIITFGPSKFKGASINAASIIQAAHAEILVGLGASGTTVIHNVTAISRRYPDLVTILNHLGADIEII